MSSLIEIALNTFPILAQEWVFVKITFSFKITYLSYFIFSFLRSSYGKNKGIGPLRAEQLESILPDEGVWLNTCSRSCSTDSRGKPGISGLQFVSSVGVRSCAVTTELNFRYIDFWTAVMMCEKTWVFRVAWTSHRSLANICWWKSLTGFPSLWCVFACAFAQWILS